MEKNPLIHAKDNARAKQTFRKKDRLIKPIEFDKVFDEAIIKLVSEHCIILATKNDNLGPRLGFVVAKKKIPLATQRNNFKRIIRNSFRKEKKNISNMDIVVLAKTNKRKLNKKILNEEINHLFEKIKKND